MSASIKEIIINQRTFFNSQQTKDITFRKKVLKKLYSEILKREKQICDALYNDFKKSEFESLISETQFTLAEIKDLIKNLKRWCEPERVLASLTNFPSQDWIYKEPYGTVLIISPWNYPFQLAMVPLASAIAAGNTVALKPSEFTPNTSHIIIQIVTAVFNKLHVTVFEGGVETSQILLKEKWDYIFFTGSTNVGKIVYKAAAENLTPVTLELGGKNPCIVDETANIKLAAKRIAWGKFLNGGQTCIAPDYILIPPQVKFDFLKELKNEITRAYGTEPKKSQDFPRIINKKNFDRLAKMLENETIVLGGITDESEFYISPTIIDEPKPDSEVMKDEIFGPILPVISYTSEEHLEEIITSYNKPLSLYIFSARKSFIKKMIKKYSFGGGCVNDTIANFTNKNLPFGGVGSSGIGAYHGKMNFDTFSHKKAIVKKANWLDIPLRYAPYGKKIWLAKKIRKLF
ncbi:aldehyde dehydrogenase [Abyssalbus ytuae]|uniref:Aldehyde dehydrogenase n=1 Tax=Abyssalbus ytuae TaxID=2926907 RepID=A0A9E6ZNP0_9FLAO|nr:aldehyde dehydrogenase [Abyssalbus ytuae]UOB17705.1 aldehyde dehydrogenase [Abyssalbus ytuae]